MRKLALAALLAATCIVVSAQTSIEYKAVHEDTVACRDKEDMQPLLDASLVDDTTAFARHMAILKIAAMVGSDCVLFKKGESAKIYERDLFGSWIVVAKRGQAGRWHSFKSWWTK